MQQVKIPGELIITIKLQITNAFYEFKNQVLLEPLPNQFSSKKIKPKIK